MGFETKSKGNERKNKQDYNKLKTFLWILNNKMKRQPTKYKKIFSSHIFDKGLIAKI